MRKRHCANFWKRTKKQVCSLLLFANSRSPTFLGDVDMACEHARELWALRADTWKGHFVWIEALLFSSLAEFAHARQHGTKRPPQLAKKHLKVIAEIEKEGGVN